jgi:hypothetical protein
VTISPGTLSSTQQHPVNAFFTKHIKLIRDGMNIWDCANTDSVAPSIRKSFLRELAAHPSTQHANEMFVKLGAMFGKNKTKVWAGIFAAASNGFLLLGRDGHKESRPTRRKGLRRQWRRH